MRSYRRTPPSGQGNRPFIDLTNGYCHNDKTSSTIKFYRRKHMQLESVYKLGRDLRTAARTMSDDEARFLVDYYYIAQEDRKRSTNQVRALDQSQEPNGVINWLADQTGSLENEIKKALDSYTENHPMGAWMRQIYGIGPVISAGLLAHIDITKAPTVGHICYYGHVYKERKAYEIARNERGDNKELAEQLKDKVGKTTDAYKHLSSGVLPPGQIDARARRYAVKLFLSHLHGAWYETHFGTKPPLPYPIAHLGHAHFIPSPV
jgi:hypothetical protein